MKHKITYILTVFGSLLLLIITPVLICAQEVTPQNKRAEIDWNRMDELKQIQAAKEKDVFQIPGVVGIGIGLMENGKDLGFVVYCEKLTPEVDSLVPYTLEGVPVRFIESGVFRAY